MPDYMNTHDHPVDLADGSILPVGEIADVSVKRAEELGLTAVSQPKADTKASTKEKS